MVHNSEKKPGDASQPLQVPRLPPRCLLDLATLCNLRCPMCPVWGSKRKDKVKELAGVMDLQASLALVDEIAPAKPVIQPNMYGEPLLAPHLKEQLRHMKDKQLSVALNTNGLKLTKELARFLLDVGVDSVFFSIDALDPDTLERIRGIREVEAIEAAVRLLLDLRGSNLHTRIGVSFTEQEANRAQKAEFVAKWIKEVDCVRVGLIYEAGRFKDLVTPEKRKPCPALYSTMAIHHDGVVSICCLDGFKSAVMGNVFKDGGVEAVWNGEKFREARALHESGRWGEIPICRNCNGWTQYDAVEEVRDGVLIRTSPQLEYYNRVDRLENWNGALMAGHKSKYAGAKKAT